MSVLIREYRESDAQALTQCLTGLQQHLVAIDTLETLRRMEDYDGKRYKDVSVQNIKKNDGILFIAEIDGVVVGMIAGALGVQSEADQLDHYPHRYGRIYELYVHEEHRSQNIGAQLVQCMEQYFKEKQCIIGRLEVMTGNTRAHSFYEKLGYEARTIDMVKKL